MKIKLLFFGLAISAISTAAFGVVQQVKPIGGVSVRSGLTPAALTKQSPGTGAIAVRAANNAVKPAGGTTEVTSAARLSNFGSAIRIKGIVANNPLKPLGGSSNVPGSGASSGGDYEADINALGARLDSVESRLDEFAGLDLDVRLTSLKEKVDGLQLTGGTSCANESEGTYMIEVKDGTEDCVPVETTGKIFSGI